MLERVRLALRITTTAYDQELVRLIDAAMRDIGILGIVVGDDALVNQAIITYCRMNFGSPDDYDRLKKSYDEQKAQLLSATGYGL